ncbi:MAG: septum formation initiator family protein [Candidatus Delongbacteria bacterium]|nr:septum formation initiator family protein [Candidatus Delongbacteria bacterium]
MALSKKRKRKRILITIVGLLVIIIGYYLFFQGSFSIFRLIEDRKLLEEKKVEVKELEKKIEQQKESNELLKNKDSFEMEKKAREQGMVKEGEKIYKYKVEKESENGL